MARPHAYNASAWPIRCRRERVRRELVRRGQRSHRSPIATRFFARVVLVPSGPVGSLSSPIGGEGASDFYELFWHGGTFDAIASISSANSNGSYEFELFNRDGSLNMDLILDAADDFSATINETLSEGLYEIGIVADSPFDPEFTTDLATPVEGPAVPEPATLPLLASACFIAFLVRVKRFGMGSRSVAGWSEIRSW